MEVVHFDEYINIDCNPDHVIDNANPLISTYSEMTAEEQGFLFALIDLYRPSKLLEIGVAEGGTTALLLKYLDKLDYKSELFSVDLCEECWNNKGKKTGFVVEDNKEEFFRNGQVAFTLYVGKYLPEVIDNVGRDIDFVILDTVHSLPGELLDYIALSPYMKSGGGYSPSRCISISQ